jgi:hypothetical protein
LGRWFRNIDTEISIRSIGHKNKDQWQKIGIYMIKHKDNWEGGMVKKNEGKEEIN